VVLTTSNNVEMDIDRFLAGLPQLAEVNMTEQARIEALSGLQAHCKVWVTRPKGLQSNPM
jgi:hypothetical protein